MGDQNSLVIASAAWLAFLHALAPDHWLPFVALAKASNWSKTRLGVVSFLAGLGHVGSSLVIGLVGVLLSKGVTELQGVEAHRGAISSVLLIGFGLAYMAWGIKHARHQDHHEHLGVDKIKDVLKLAFARRFWILFAVIVFGPCEPLIPLIFLAWMKGASALIATISIFSAITVLLVVAQSLLAFKGLSLLSGKYEQVLARHAHTLAGATILAVGLLVVFLGL